MTKNIKKSLILSILIKSLIILIGFSGIIATISAGSFMIGYTAFLYYTIQSNLFVIIISIIFLSFHCIEFIKGKKVIDNRWRLIKFSLTVAITITLLVFFILLAPTLSTEYLLSFDNFSVHLNVPLLALIDFFLFDYQIDLSGIKPLVSLALPLYYLIFAFCLSMFDVTFNGEIVPYYFLNYINLGWFWEKGQLGVIFWIVILCGCIILISYLFSYALKYRNRNQNKIK